MKRRLIVLISIVIGLFTLGSCFNRGDDHRPQIYSKDDFYLKLSTTRSEVLYKSGLPMESIPPLSMDESYIFYISDLSPSEIELIYDSEKISLSWIENTVDWAEYLLKVEERFDETTVSVKYISEESGEEIINSMVIKCEPLTETEE